MAKPSLCLLSFLFFLVTQTAAFPLLGSLLNTVTSTVVAVTDTLKNLTSSVVDPLIPLYSLQDANTTARSAGVLLKQATFLYGPSVGGGPYFPTGPLGLAKVVADQALIELDLVPQVALVGLDSVDLTAATSQSKGLKTLEDYIQLYKNQLQRSLPSGPELGALTNFTQDLFFSMERLANSPYKIRRLFPASDILQFNIDDATTKNITNSTLQQLFVSGRLFYADHRDQKDLIRAARYSAACDAYFYIDSISGKLLPLAIRTNVGANLIYTPLDSPNDWLLAKMMYNVNDFYFAQTSHLASTHEVVQISYMAAIRTLSDNHPVLGLLNRLTYELFAIQPLALVVLFTPGTVFDQVFPYTGLASQAYSSKLYTDGEQGRFQANYFQTNLKNRGLINSTLGPELSSFPFFEDGSVIYASLRTFMASFVSSYYASDAAVKADAELQAWVQEARGPAAARDFPSIATTSDLVDALTHIAHLVSLSHHTVNTNQILAVSATLPFHPLALYQEPPTAKGVVDIVPFLPPLDKVLTQFASGGLFARPLLMGGNRTLIHMFDDQTMLNRMNSQTRAAAAKFMVDMQTFSATVSSRKFNARGLSQGMPFLWKGLDPNIIPWSLTI